MSGRVSIVLPLVLLLAACGQKPEIDLGAAPEGAIEQGVSLMATHCHTCHGVGERTMEEMLAPPLWGVRAHYLKRYPQPEAFVEAMASFLLEPENDRSLMPLAVARYGLKAPVSLAEAEMRAVAWAIYAGQVERPAWSRDYRRQHGTCEASWSHSF
jgi:hypothetical protein